MSYNNHAVKKKQKNLVSKSGRNKRKFFVGFFKVVLVVFVVAIVALAGAGFGMMKGILDNAPEKLLVIPGISENRLEKISESYLANRAARDVVAFLAPYGITANRAVKLFQQYGNKTLETVKEHPYTLYEMAGVGFITADKIARSMGTSELSPERIDAALLYTLEDAECKGNLCLEKHAFIHSCLKMLATPGLTEEMAANRAMRMVIDGRLATYGGFAYRSQTALAEEDLADRIVCRLKDDCIADVDEIDRLLSEEEKAAHPARFCLCEIVSVQDPALVFEPIHRVVFDSHGDFVNYAADRLKGAGSCVMISGGVRRIIPVNADPAHGIAEIQSVIDGYIKENPQVTVDYVHGAYNTEQVAAREGGTAIIMPLITKENLFSCVKSRGTLPRKSFSMGEGRDKRYYFEARIITDKYKISDDKVIRSGNED